MKTKVKALTSFMHGRVHAHLGDELEVTKGEADELEKVGLAAPVKDEPAPVEQSKAPAPEKAPQAAEADTDVDDLLGGEKMDAEPQNKMDAEPENKAGEKKSTHSRKK